MEAQTTWTALRHHLKTNGITEQQYHDWLVKNTTPPIVDEVLRLIVNHVYHSDEERLIAPPHLRVDENGNLHEVVGHKGLRELFGAETYDGKMNELFSRLPEAEQEKVRAAANAKYKGDISVTMDEYLVEQAEKDELPVVGTCGVGRKRHAAQIRL